MSSRRSSHILSQDSEAEESLRPRRGRSGLEIVAPSGVHTQRHEEFGVMNPARAGNTTQHPDTRTILRMTVEGTAEAGLIFKRLMIEKALGQDADVNGVMEETDHMLTRANGLSQGAARERSSAEGAALPSRAHWTERLPGWVGFSSVDFLWWSTSSADRIAIR